LIEIDATLMRGVESAGPNMDEPGAAAVAIEGQGTRQDVADRMSGAACQAIVPWWGLEPSFFIRTGEPPTPAWTPQPTSC
jgi:hypothetical protein